MRSVCRFGPFTLDVERYDLRREDGRIRISVSLAKLLILFVNHAGELLTREEIAACLWEEPQSVDITNGINTAVNRLRAVLGDAPAQPIYIETMVGLGYRFVAEVEILPQQTVPGAGGSNTSPWADGAQNSLTAEAPVTVTPERAASDFHTPSANEVGARKQDASAREIFLPANRGAAEVPAHTTKRAAWRWGLALLIALSITGATLLRLKVWPRSFHSTASYTAQRITFTQATFHDINDPITVATISHDGHSIAFADRAGISVRLLEHEVDRTLVSPSALQPDRITWSPDDTTLLVSGKSSTSGALEVWIVSLGAEPPKLLFEDGADAVYSPDGSRIAFTRRRGSEIWSAGSRGESLRKLVLAREEDSFSSLLWAPQGNRLVCQLRSTPAEEPAANAPVQQVERKYRWDYESVDAATGALLSIERDIRFNSAYLLADGSMYFPSNQVSEGHASARLLMVRTDPQSGRFLSKPQLAGNFDGNSAFSISAANSGSQTAALLRQNSADIYVGKIHFPGPRLDRVRRLIHPSPNNYPHAWTPSGGAVIFESDRLSKYSIYLQKTDGSAAGLIASSVGGAVLPQVSPDGKWVLFENLPHYRPNTILRVPLNGGDLVQVPTHGLVEEFQCSVSLRGSCVLRQADGKYLDYFALDPVTGQGKLIGRTAWMETLLGDWSLSPDGTTVAVPVHDPANPAIRLITLSSGTPSRAFDIPVPGFGTLLQATWAPDARGFYVEAQDDNRTVLLYIDRAGRASLLRQTESPTWGVPSRDGTNLAFVNQDVNVNVWIGPESSSK